MKKKIIIISILIVSILSIINFLCPRDLGKLIDKNELIINVQSIKITKMTVRGEDYLIDFYGNNIENAGWIQITSGKYITCYTQKQRVSQRGKTIHPYKFVTDFDYEYFKQAFYED